MGGHANAAERRSRLSIPSVRTIGDVVKVMRLETRRSRTRRRDILTPMMMPSLVRLKNFQCQSTSPGSVKKWIKRVKRMMTQRGLMDFSRRPGGSLARPAARTKKAIKSPY